MRVVSNILSFYGSKYCFLDNDHLVDSPLVRLQFGYPDFISRLTASFRREFLIRLFNGYFILLLFPV